MRITIFTIIIILHVLADFYFQSEEVARNKKSSYRCICIHALQYAIPFALVFIFIKFSLMFLICIVLAVLAHWLIDSAKYLVLKKNSFNWMTEKSGIIFATDQLLHLLSILLISLLFIRFDHEGILLYRIWSDILSIVNQDPGFAIQWLLMILLILKPANIVFRMMFLAYRPENEENGGIDATKRKAGAIIGCLERILLVFFISAGQYSALGFILAAKSIARYDAITKDRKFAEYYLIGTLVSVVYSIIAYKLVFTGLY